jgi:glycosyltransferase involved in cell wall biosynthesis
MIRVLFIQRFMLHYRVNLIARIANMPDINLLFIHGRGIKNSKFVNYEGQVNFKHKQLTTFIWTSNRKKLVFFPTLIYHLIKQKPDVIVTEGESNMLNNTVIYFYSFFSKVKLIWWGLGLIPGHTESLYQKLYKPIMNKFLLKTTYMIGYSNYSKEYYSNFVSKDKILVAHNCLDNNKIDNEISEFKDSVKTVKNIFNLHDKFVIIFVGGFQKSKRVDNLIRAYDIIKKKYSKTALLIVGESKEKQMLLNLIDELGIKDIHFVGKQIEEISKYFLSADLFVLPGLGGLSIYHAMVHSLPVISASADGTERDLIRNGYNGFILKTYNIDELVNKIKMFLENKKLSTEMGMNSRKIVDKDINIQKMVSIFDYAIKNSIS